MSTGPLDEISTWFWDLIAKAQGSTRKLRKLLQPMSSEELTRFEDEFQWAAGYLRDEPFTNYVDKRVSEDGVDDIAHFVVSRGREFYFNVWENPSTIPSYVDEQDPRILAGVATDVHWEKFGTEIDLDIDRERPYK